MDDDLTERQRQILAFERQWWKYAGARTAGVRELFGCSATVYRRELDRLIDLPAALAHDPLVVKRLQRRRTAGQWAGRHPAGSKLG